MFTVNYKQGIIVNSSECTIRRTEFYKNGHNGGGSGCSLIIDNWVCRVTECNFYQDSRCVIIGKYAKDIVLRDCAIGSAKNNLVECFGGLVIFDNVRFVGADTSTSGTHWFGDLMIGESDSELTRQPIYIRDCTFDSGLSNYNININDGNSRKIIVDSPIILSDADSFTSS